MSRIETALSTALAQADAGAPPLLTAALRYAVFPGGARVRPRLCLAVSAACGAPNSPLAEAAAIAIELLHCASLVHDDLPCFDDAALRRGRPALHRVYGEPLAVLTGDALIVLSFETVARVATLAGARLAPLLLTLTQAAGAPSGLVAGQAWESEPSVCLTRYHRAKTGCLFYAAVMAGVLAAGHDPGPWQGVGWAIGEAYQVADDLLDATGPDGAVGKPTRQDLRLGRPNAVAELGVSGAIARLRELSAAAASQVPPSPGADGLRALIGDIVARLVPATIESSAQKSEALSSLAADPKPGPATDQQVAA